MSEENYYGLPPESQKIYETAKETNINNVIVERNSLMSENIRLRTQLQQKDNIIKGLDNTIQNLEEVMEHKDNIIKEIKAQLDYLETYSSKEDVFEDMSRRLNRIEKIIYDSKENK